MENLIEHCESVTASFRRMKSVTIACITASVAVAALALYFCMASIARGQERIYILDKGTALSATLENGDAHRDLETEDHVRRFHELMFNITPNSESIQRNLDRALVMSDRSAYDYWMDMSERGFYQRMVSANITQEIVIDSVKVDLSEYPYPVHTWANLYILRESNITSYAFESSCRLVDVGRSPSNPHGLMVEKFTVNRHEKTGTRRRE